MLNYIWAVMMILGITYAAFTGNIDAVSNGIIDSSKEAITLCITMLGIMSFWTGLMETARTSGVMSQMTKVVSPFVKFMFPDIPKDHKCREYITTNIVANILGLGWAATPAGLKAMEELAELEEERHNLGGEIRSASNNMCTFLVLNISSLQLIPVNIIAYRSQYGSVDPASIAGPAIVATFVSTLVGIIFCKYMCRKC